jgi:hypothetical protein
MAILLRPGLTFCLIDEIAMFLDVPEDRYFRLSPRANNAFLAWCAGASLSDEEHAALDTAGLLASRLPRPLASAPVAVPDRQSPQVSRGDFHLGETARAVWVQRRIEHRLRSVGLEIALRDFARARRASCSRRAKSTQGAAAVVRAFEHARILRSPADKCLPRSLAMALCLARHGVHADVVLAVKLGPFAAHCWAQADGEVLNDTAEEVARYTPILVV